MNNTLKIVSCLLFFALLVVSCGCDKNCSGKGKCKHSSVNPNGDSELSSLMRDMYDEAEQIKAQIANGEELSFSVDHQRILSAEATQAHKAASDEFQAFAGAYLHSVKSLKTAAPSKMLSIYDGMVDNCTNCHKALCPGPLVKIKKLR